MFFDDWEIFLQTISSQLQVFRLNTSFDINYISADRWERLIIGHCLHLRKFHFRYEKLDSHVFTFVPYHTSIGHYHFLSPFWINQRWLFKLAINTSCQTSGMIFAIFSEKYEMKLFRYFPNFLI